MFSHESFLVEADDYPNHVEEVSQNGAEPFTQTSNPTWAESARIDELVCCSTSIGVQKSRVSWISHESSVSSGSPRSFYARVRQASVSVRNLFVYAATSDTHHG